MYELFHYSVWDISSHMIKILQSLFMSVLCEGWKEILLS